MISSWIKPDWMQSYYQNFQTFNQIFHCCLVFMSTVKFSLGCCPDKMQGTYRGIINNPVLIPPTPLPSAWLNFSAPNNSFCQHSTNSESQHTGKKSKFRQYWSEATESWNWSLGTEYEVRNLFYFWNIAGSTSEELIVDILIQCLRASLLHSGAFKKSIKFSNCFLRIHNCPLWLTGVFLLSVGFFFYSSLNNSDLLSAGWFFSMP